jgi:hypothetical protein
LLQAVAPSTVAWVGEAGGAYNSGHHLVTDAFIFSFWSAHSVLATLGLDVLVYYLLFSSGLALWPFIGYMMEFRELFGVLSLEA